MRTATQQGDRVAVMALVGGGLLAGGNPVGVRFTVLELDALWGAALRFALASLLLAGMMAALRLRLPHGAALRGAALYGLLNFGGAFAAAYYALSHIQAGLASTLIALVPLATLVLAVAQRREQLRLMAVVGGVLALAGVALVSKVSLAGAVPHLALLAAVAAVVCMGQAAIVARGIAQRHDLHPVVLNAVGMAVGAVVLLAGALVAGDQIVLPRQPATWWAIGYVVLGGSIGVFMLYLAVLRHWEASRAAYLTMLMPPVAMALSSWLDHEPITAGLVVGGGLILAGVYVGAVRPRSAAPPSTCPGRLPSLHWMSHDHPDDAGKVWCCEWTVEDAREIGERTRRWWRVLPVRSGPGCDLLDLDPRASGGWGHARSAPPWGCHRGDDRRCGAVDLGRERRGGPAGGPRGTAHVHVRRPAP